MTQVSTPSEPPRAARARTAHQAPKRYFVVLTMFYTGVSAWLLVSAFATASSLRWAALAAAAITLPVMWGLTYLHSPAHHDLRRYLAPLLWLRRRPALLWLLLLLGVSAYLVGWIMVMQPAYADIGPFDAWILALGLWGVSFVLGYEATPQASGHLKNNPFTGPLISVTTVLFILFFAELGMRMLLVQTDSGGGTLWSMRWFELYWNPINELGYRDYSVNKPTGVFHITSVGDSFAAGHGVKRVDDLLNYELVERLGPDYTTSIVAWRGWTTQQQLDALREYPIEADYVVLSYMLNDIHPAAIDTGVVAPLAYKQTNSALIWLSQRFYLADLIWYSLAIPDRRGEYFDNLIAAFKDEETWKNHSAELQALTDHVTAQEAKLIVVAWPFLGRIQQSQADIDQIERFFNEQAVPVVDMGEVLKNEPLSRVVASVFDSHPSAYSHQLAAEAIYDVFPAR
jgi:hypothetical protein